MTSMLQKLTRKLAIMVRRSRESERRTLTSREAQEVNFYQFNRRTVGYFHARLGHTMVRVRDTPHFAFACALGGDKSVSAAEGESAYRDYLRASWQESAHEHIDERVAEFRDHFESWKRAGSSAHPILVNLPTDAAPYAIDGNHRLAFAAALGRPIEVEIWPPDLAFLRFSRIPGFYGTGNRNLPYQGVVLGGREVIPGRRSDIALRLSMVPSHVLSGRSVLDVASNVGMSSLIARSLGASSCRGLEISPGMVDLASRFAAFSGVHPEVTFTEFNIDTDNLTDGEVYDTAFMFSILAHLKRPDRLAEIARRHVRHFVVFEGHPSGTHRDYADFFAACGFSQVEELGRLDTSRFDGDRKRTLWLCSKASAN
ncbi:MAG: methyltransferase domain-containing protein [Gammaproteobacteria bacterium]|nr:methyltransferase domain-containing protein [Gammaproteobacteria bacterium]